MTIKLGVVMDPISGINPRKDSTFAMLLAAQARGHILYYLETRDLELSGGRVLGHLRRIELKDAVNDWYTLGDPHTMPLAHLDAILMRLDPPVNDTYLYTTYLLELAQRDGVLVLNDPRSLRDANEKLFTSYFPELVPPTLVSATPARILEFLGEHGDIVVKPLNGLGGANVFRITAGDPNTNVILEILTQRGREFTMAQRYIPAIIKGDKRILMIDGEPIPYALARIPKEGELRGNLAAGGRGIGRALSPRDLEICAQVGPELHSRGLLFVGLDVIGDYLTEINVTSPTCIRELEAAYQIPIAARLIDVIEARVAEM